VISGYLLFQRIFVHFILTFFSMPKESNKEKASETTTVPVFRHLHRAISRSKKQEAVRAVSDSPPA